MVEASLESVVEESVASRVEESVVEEILVEESVVEAVPEEQESRPHRQRPRPDDVVRLDLGHAAALAAPAAAGFPWPGTPAGAARAVPPLVGVVRGADRHTARGDDGAPSSESDLLPSDDVWAAARRAGSSRRWPP